MSPLRPRSVRPSRALPLLLAAAALAVACGGERGGAGGETAEAARRVPLAGAAAGRNVVLFTVDTVRADRLNAYGYAVRETSPRLDRMLAEGVLFENATAPRALTWPSLASVLTGLYPSGHGVLENGWELAPEVVTLAERMRQAGYVTGAFLGNMCGEEPQGFDATSCTAGQDGKVVARAVEWLSSLDGERPFFVWVHMFAAHGPYYNGGDRANQLDPGYEGLLGPKKWRLDRVMVEQLELDEREVRHLDALYDAAVIGTDHIAAGFLDALPHLSPPEETLLVFAADHGEDLYDHHGYLYHACSVYQTSLHVPLGIAAPGLVPAGARVAQSVELVDVAPTVLELLGMEPLADAHGVSLVPWLERAGSGGGGGGRPAFSEYGATEIHTVQSDGWKLVWNPEALSPYCMAEAPEGHYPIEPVELYDLAADPLELRNLAEEERARVVRMAQLLEQRFSGLSRRDGAQEVSPELREQLRALGYVAN
jgi:arylsulfatase A-like enzyme